MAYEEVTGEVREDAISALVEKANGDGVKLPKSYLEHVVIKKKEDEFLVIYQLLDPDKVPIRTQYLGQYRPSDHSYEGRIPEIDKGNSTPALNPLKSSIQEGVKAAGASANNKSEALFARGPRFAQ